MGVSRPSKQAPRSRNSPAKRGDRSWQGAALGIDLGGTKIALGIVAADGRILDGDRLATRADRPAGEVIAEIATHVRERWGGRLPRTRPAGVGVAGQVDRKGNVVFGPHLGWHEVPLGTDLARELSRPVSVLNDVQAAIYGEWKHGAARGLDNVLGVFVGTGVGGGIILDGQLRQGAVGCAGEFGHLSVERDGRKCHCPGSGCLDAYVGGWAIAERARAAVERAPDDGRRLLAIAGTARAITSETVEEAFLAGDPLARTIVQDTIDYLADGLVAIVNSFNPETVVLGGGVFHGLRSLLPSLERRVKARALPAVARVLHIVPAALGGESGVVGAATFARDGAAR